MFILTCVCPNISPVPSACGFLSAEGSSAWTSPSLSTSSTWLVAGSTTPTFQLLCPGGLSTLPAWLWWLWLGSTCACGLSSGQSLSTQAPNPTSDSLTAHSDADVGTSWQDSWPWELGVLDSIGRQQMQMDWDKKTEDKPFCHNFPLYTEIVHLYSS